MIGGKKLSVVLIFVALAIFGTYTASIFAETPDIQFRLTVCDYDAESDTVLFREFGPSMLTVMPKCFYHSKIDDVEVIVDNSQKTVVVQGFGKAEKTDKLFEFYKKAIVACPSEKQADEWKKQLQYLKKQQGSPAFHYYDSHINLQSGEVRLEVRDIFGREHVYFVPIQNVEVQIENDGGVSTANIRFSDKDSERGYDDRYKKVILFAESQVYLEDYQDCFNTYKKAYEEYKSRHNQRPFPMH